MKGTFVLLVFICLMAALSSCKKNDVGDELDEIAIRCNVKLTSGNSTTLILNFSGGKFECDNVALDYEIHWSENAIFLTIGKSYIPYGMPCYGNSHNETYSAKGAVTIEDIENGNYVLVISALDNILYAGLQIDEKKISIVNGKGSIISFGSDPYVTFKIPKDAIWGVASSYPDSLAHLFKDSLIALGAVPYAPLLENGNYGSFSLSNGSLWWNYGGDDEFLLKTNMDTTAIRGLMKYFCNNEIVDWVEVFTGKGDDLMQY